MVILNNNVREKSFSCKKAIMEYLVYEKKLPILSYDTDYYYFAKTKELVKALETMPFYLRVIAFFQK